MHSLQHSLVMIYHSAYFQEQTEQAKTFTKRLRKIFDNLGRIFLRSRVLKEVELSSRKFPYLPAESAQQQVPSQKLIGTKKKFATPKHIIIVSR